MNTNTETKMSMCDLYGFRSLVRSYDLECEVVDLRRIENDDINHINIQLLLLYPVKCPASNIEIDIAEVTFVDSAAALARACEVYVDKAYNDDTGFINDVYVNAFKLRLMVVG